MSSGGEGAVLGGRTLAIATLACLVAAGSGVAWYGEHRGASRDTVEAAAKSPPPSGAAPAPGGLGGAPDSVALPPGETSAPQSEEEALGELQGLRAASLPRLVLDDRYVAQVASKSVGTTDPLQVAANGTHVFYAADILLESRAAVRTVSDPKSVLVLQSIDFGRRSFAADGQPYWVTVVDAGFAGAGDVEAWCSETYPSLSPQELHNTCAVRTLTPPHQ